MPRRKFLNRGLRSARIRRGKKYQTARSMRRPTKQSGPINNNNIGMLNAPGGNGFGAAGPGGSHATDAWIVRCCAHPNGVTVNTKAEMSAALGQCWDAGCDGASWYPA